ncbi:uncharacterized protein PAC_11698 [Phialocephala subalpina]|uniref:2EXR domain-containing protein n=1 Tax=Phialocephala subalpina TaxID=576137 RepID=A0A1L7X9V1_9HELO|nr:uncharacterized protein PAC_11698 [Phialocephala subalpina]
MANPRTCKQSSASPKKKPTQKPQVSSRRSSNPPQPPPKSHRSPPTQVDNASPLPLTSFTKFKKLTPELRVKIWNTGIPEPSTKQFYIKFRRGNNGEAVIRFQATRAQDAFGLQLACCESRHEWLKALPYRLLSIDRNCEYRFSDLDTICIINGHEMIDMFQYILPADANAMKLGAWAGQVKTLRLSSRSLYSYNQIEHQAVARMLAEFKQLSELKIVMVYRDETERFGFHEDELVELGRSIHPVRALLLDVNVAREVTKGMEGFGGCTRPCKQALRSVVGLMNRSVLRAHLLSQLPRVPMTLLTRKDWTSEVKKYWQPRD